MSELRQDRSTGAWVVIAPERNRRPRAWPAPPAQDAAVAGTADCPFCPGHEALLAAIADEIGQASEPGWRARAVLNRYPIVATGEPPQPRQAGHHRSRDGLGRHEVIIESPRHDADLADFTDAEIEAAVRMWHRRYLALSALPGIEAVILFRNHGRRAGASQIHPHAQIVGLGALPPGCRAAARWARAAFQANGGCPTCAGLAAEQAEDVRIVEDGGQLVALVPFAATAPYELWLLPKRHAASFAAARPEELIELGTLLRRALRRQRAVLGEVSYNLVIDSAPRRWANARYLHWKLRIVPSLVTPGGFELGSGLALNPSLPEADATALRAALARPR